MIGEKTTLEILGEIQERLRGKGYPVKIDFSEPIEGADIGLKVIIQGERNWELERQLWRCPKKYVSFIVKPTVACVPSKGDTLFQVSAVLTVLAGFCLADAYRTKV
jgi:hypothetical protein